MKLNRFAVWLVAIAVLSSLAAFSGSLWAQAQTPRQVEAKLETKDLVSINRANIQDFQQVNGIGPMLAERIISYREANGPFKSLDQLKEVKGIGDAKFEKIKSQITL